MRHEVTWYEDGVDVRSEDWEYDIDNTAKLRAIADTLPPNQYVSIALFNTFVRFGEVVEREHQVGGKTFIGPRRVKLVIEIECSIFDPDWNERMIIENAPTYLVSMIGDGQEDNLEREGVGAYWLDEDDLGMWIADDYIKDLADWAAALRADQTATPARSTITTLPSLHAFLDEIERDLDTGLEQDVNIEPDQQNERARIDACMAIYERLRVGRDTLVALDPSTFGIDMARNRLRSLVARALGERFGMTPEEVTRLVEPLT